MKKKNQKVADLKKLAMLGLAAGLLMPSQAIMADSAQFSETNFDHYLANGGCGSNSCAHHGSGSNSGYYQQQYSYAQPQYSCHAQNWQAQSGCQMHQSQQNWQAQSGCQMHQSQQNWQANSGCGAHQPQQNWQAKSGCGANSGQHYQSLADNDDQNSNSNDQNYNMQPVQQGSQANKQNARSNYSIAEADVVTTKTAPMSEKDLMNSVNAQSKAAFQSLSPEGKALALKLANQDCKGKNSCKGQNSCAVAGKNDCAGKGGCKGQSKGPFTDKNVAIKVAAMKMAEKRNGVLNK